MIYTESEHPDEADGFGAAELRGRLLRTGEVVTDWWCSGCGEHYYGLVGDHECTLPSPEIDKAHKYSITWGSQERWTWFYAGIGPGYGMTVWALEIGNFTMSWHRKDS